jgi:hypothetical protein
MSRIALPYEAVTEAIRELDVDLLVKARTDGGFRAPEITRSMYEEAVTPAVIAALNAIDREWLLPTILGVTVDQFREALLPAAAERDLDGDSTQADTLFRLLLLKGGNVDQLPDGRRWLALALRAFADLIDGN